MLDIQATSTGGFKVLVSLNNHYYLYGVVWLDNYGKIESIRYWYKSGTYTIRSGQFIPDGGAILSGESKISTDKYGGLLIKLDSFGQVEWEQKYEDPDASLEFHCVIDFASGGYIIAGNRRLYLDNSYESLLIRTDEHGQVADAPQ